MVKQVCTTDAAAPQELIASPPSEQHDLDLAVLDPLQYLRAAQDRPEELVPRLWDVQDIALLGIAEGDVENDVREGSRGEGICRIVGEQ